MLPKKDYIGLLIPPRVGKQLWNTLNARTNRIEALALLTAESTYKNFEPKEIFD
jgi:hypothetical protein